MRFAHHKLDAFHVARSALCAGDALVKKLPRGYATLGDQLRRALLGTYLQLTEAAARDGNDRRQRFRCARAECNEAQRPSRPPWRSGWWPSPRGRSSSSRSIAWRPCSPGSAVGGAERPGAGPLRGPRRQLAACVRERESWHEGRVCVCVRGSERGCGRGRRHAAERVRAAQRPAVVPDRTRSRTRGREPQAARPRTPAATRFVIPEGGLAAAHAHEHAHHRRPDHPRGTSNASHRESSGRVARRGLRPACACAAASAAAAGVGGTGRAGAVRTRNGVLHDARPQPRPRTQPSAYVRPSVPQSSPTAHAAAHAAASPRPRGPEPQPRRAS